MHSILPLSTQRHISDRPTTPLPVDCVRLPRGRSERRKIEQVAAADRHQPHEFQPTTFPTRRRQGSAFGNENYMNNPLSILIALVAQSQPRHGFPETHTRSTCCAMNAASWCRCLTPRRFALLIFIIFLIPHISHGSEAQALGANRPIRSLLLLDKSVEITNVSRARVRLDLDLAGEDGNFKHLDKSKLDDLSRDPTGESSVYFTLVYFTFESTTDLQGLMSHSEVLKTEKVKKVTMKDSFADSWVVPAFPVDVLREADGVSVAWLRDAKVLDLCLVPTREGIGDKKHYKFFGCVVVYDQPTSGNVPELQIDHNGKRKD